MSKTDLSVDLDCETKETSQDFLLKIVAKHKNISNNKARKLVRQGEVFVNENKIVDPLFWPSSGSKVVIEKCLFVKIS